MRPAQRRYVDDVLPHVADERRDLADLLDDLEPDAWTTPSLCGRWTVRDVVAHLTLSTETRTVPTLLAVARARGDLDGVFDREARERAVLDPAELIDRLRAAAGSSHRLGISSAIDPLNDLLVHGQDIVRLLGIERTMPVERVRMVIDTVWTSPMYGGSKRFAGLRCVASDTSWSAGEGPEVRGPVGDLLLLATGRRAGLDRLEGPGVDEATARMA